MTSMADRSDAPGSAESASALSAEDAESAAISPLGVALDRVGDRWTLLVVDALLDGSRRFNELGEALPAIAPNILSNRLRRLEREGLVRATPYSHRPPRMEYALTAEGQALAGALRLLADWGSRHLAREGGPEPLRHATCGTALEARWYCPTCSTVVDDREATETRLI
jgi:DNA-binding HxlR family transcriptional regulator